MEKAVMKEDNNQSRIVAVGNFEDAYIVWKRYTTKLTEVVPLLFCIFFTSGRFLYFVCIEVNIVLIFLFIHIDLFCTVL